MNRQLSRFGALALAGAVGLVLAVPAVASAQRTQTTDDGGARSGGGDSGGRAVAVPRDSGGSSGGGGGRSSGGGGDSSRGGGGFAGPTTRSEPSPSDGGRAVPRRPRDDRQPVGRAIPRSDVPPVPIGTVVIGGGTYYGGYYPWGYGGLGLGGYYGLYDPWWYDPFYYGGGGYGGYYDSGYAGRLRLRVKPSDAEVFVDGYYAGEVDEFDNVFQHLSIETGPHRIEIREEGYEPLNFEVRILPGRTITYRGELKRIP
jgi:hypothetical protein